MPSLLAESTLSAIEKVPQLRPHVQQKEGMTTTTDVVKRTRSDINAPTPRIYARDIIIEVFNGGGKGEGKGEGEEEDAAAFTFASAVEQQCYEDAISYAANAGLFPKWSNEPFMQKYDANVRRICCNADSVHFVTMLKTAVADGTISRLNLESMTPETMKAEVWAEYRLRYEKSGQMEVVADGLNKCKRCGSNKTVTEQRQTRSADEGVTVFVTCLSCGVRSKHAS